MDFEKFSHPENKVVGYSRKPDLQKEVNESKYFDLRIPKSTTETLNLEKGDLLQVVIRNQQGETDEFKKEAGERTGGLKIYLPRSVIEKLSVSEDELLDVFLSKY